MWDTDLFLWLNFDGGALLDKAMLFASGKLSWVPLYLFILYLVYRREGWRGVAIFLVGALAIVGLSDIVAGVFKHTGPLKALLPEFPARLRPMHTPELEGIIHAISKGGKYGTVSAHAATTLGVALWSICRVPCRVIYIIMPIYAVAVAYSRIYLGVHFPQDILLGWGVGAIATLIVVLLTSLILKKGCKKSRK